MIRRPLLALPLIAAALCIAPWARAENPYTQTKNIVYAETDGIGLVMDIFTPTGPANGLGIVDVVSGAWDSGRSKIEQHRMAKMYDIFCGRGYTVFAVRPGSITKFSHLEMVKHVKQGITWAKEHAAEYKVDPNRLGLAGASAGGHLASLTAVTSDDKTAVKAVGIFFPPTNFLNYRGMKVDENSTPEQLATIKRLIFPNHNGPAEAKEIIAKLTEISPALLCTSKAPPFLIIHGDADPLVPLDQSEMLQASLKNCNVQCELIVKKGGAHPWPTIHEEVAVIADYFDKTLGAKQ